MGAIIFLMWHAVGDDHQDWMVGLLTADGAASIGGITGGQQLAGVRAGTCSQKCVHFNWKNSQLGSRNVFFPSSSNWAGKVCACTCAGSGIVGFSLHTLMAGAIPMVAHGMCLVWYPAPLHQTDSFAFATTFLGAW